MKRSFPVFLPLLLSLIPLILLTGCFEDPSAYIDCEIDALVDAINDANADPDPTTIKLTPDCTYIVDQQYGTMEAGLPFITTEIIVEGNGATITRPGLGQQIDRYRFFYISDPGSLEISDITLDGGYIYAPVGIVDDYQSAAGAILNRGFLNVRDVLFINNHASYGGAVANVYQGEMIIQNSVFRNNQGRHRGGAIYNNGDYGAQIAGVVFEGNETPGTHLVMGYGGAIWNAEGLTITNSSFVGNLAGRAGGAIQNAGVLSINNSTFTGNGTTRYGPSAIHNYGSGSLTIQNSTISGNSSVGVNGNTIYSEAGSLMISYSTIVNNSGAGEGLKSENGAIISNSIIANNTGGDCDPALALSTTGNNIDSDGSCSGFITADPLLEPLADNGGATMTHALDPNSPAINLGSGDCPGIDQRGVSRPYGSACDLGAYESEAGTSVCDVQFIIDAINDANMDPDSTTIELNPGCIYLIDQDFIGPVSTLQTQTGLPIITTEVIIHGNGATITRPSIIDQPHGYRLLSVEETGILSISDLTLSNGDIFCPKTPTWPHGDYGGAIYNEGTLNLTRVILEDNKACLGGAISNMDSAILNIENSIFDNNKAGRSGGAIHNIGEAHIAETEFDSNNTGNLMLADSGGGIANLGQMSVTNCSFFRNETGSKGGAISNRLQTSNLYISGSSFNNNWSSRSGASGISIAEGTVEVHNSTFYFNRSNSSVRNVIYNDSGELIISYSSIVNNFGGIAMVSSDNTDVTISNSIITTYGYAVNCDFPGAITTIGNNLSTDNSCAGFTVVGDLRLGSFGDYGGTTLTIPLKPDSPAIDMASGNCPAADQRGVSRPSSFFCDLGAYEAEEVETCSINYLVNAINHANSDPDPTTIELDPNCTYLVDQQYGDRKTGLPHLLTNINILGNGATITRPGLEVQPADYRFFYVENNVPVSISDLTLTGGIVQGIGGVYRDSDSHGGAIFNRGDLALASVNFTDNQALYGGAIMSTDRGSLSIMNNTFSENHAAVNGGALDLKGSGGTRITGGFFERNQAEGSTSAAMGYGGAIYNDESLIITSSTFSWNESHAGGGGIYTKRNLDLEKSTLRGNSSYAEGGSALVNNGGTVNLFNSTVSGNNAPEGDYYAVENRGGLIRASFSTITENRGGSAALGGVGHPDNYQYIVFNSIIAANPAGDCGQVGTLSSLGRNVDSDSSCPDFSTTDHINLEPLADNGGGTWTHALTIDSPALNAASGECPLKDQRGEPRPQGSACDLGAYEYDGPQPIPSPTPEIDPCMYEAISNTNCRESIYPESDFVASLPQGDSARLIGICTLGTHGLFELPSGEKCWMMMSLLTGIDPGVCNPSFVVPPPRPTPSSSTGSTLTCRADLSQAACIETGGTWNTQGINPTCICP